MGLIRAAVNSAKGVLADQWKEYFYCEAMPPNVLGVKGKKKTSRMAVNNGDDNIITNGSIIAVADGQCMIIVEQGKVVDYCAEPGEYTYEVSTEPSLFDGGALSDNIKSVFNNMGKRFTFGATTAKDQRVYFFNTKELVGNKFGTPNPVPFRVVDERAGIDIDFGVRCFGEYSYKLTNPILFYANVCGNFIGSYTKEQLDSQMKTELISALQPAFAKISEMGIRYSQLPGHAQELAGLLNTELTAKWKDLRGVEVVSCAISSVTVDEEDEKMIKEMQRNAAFKDPLAAAAYMVGSTGAAMQTAAGNSGGAAIGFMGMNMAQNAGGVNAQNLFQMANQQEASKPQEAPKPSETPKAGSWTCSCGSVNTGNFCPNCGKRNPKMPWTCSCGSVNTGNFCPNCGAKKPE